MTVAKAARIEELRTGPVMHSWRRISEIICEEFPDEPQEMSGNQLHGIDLCKEAMLVLRGDPRLKNVSELPDHVRMRWAT